MIKAAIVLSSILLIVCPLAFAQAPADVPYSSADFDKLVDHYFERYFEFHPTRGTAAGFHQYDDQLDDFSQKGRDSEIAFLTGYRQEFGIFHPEHLTDTQRVDLKLLENAIDARMLELREIRMWQKNAGMYANNATVSIFRLISRNFAPPEQRLKSVIAREQKIPANLSAAETNLKNPPRIYTEIAIRQMPGIIRFFQNDVPAAFKGVTDQSLLAQFKQSNDNVIRELERYQDFLKSDLLPISNGDFRLGPELYRKKLLYEEMVDIPLDRLLQIGYDDLHKNQAELKRVAAQIDPGENAGANPD